MKPTVYINVVNEALLNELKKHKKNFCLSNVVNEALEMYLSSANFDCAELRQKKDYKLVVFRFPIALINLLQKMKANYKFTRVVSNTVMKLVVQELDRQNDRKRPTDKFPKAVYVETEYISKVLKRLLSK